MDNPRGAFTLIELLIVVAIAIAIGVVTFANYSGKQATTEMNATSQEIATLLHEAQSRTLAGDENGTSWNGFWGVQFGNPTGTDAYYSLFFGSSTSALASSTFVSGRNQLPPDITYTTSSVASAGALYVYFAANGTAAAACSGFTCPTGTSTITIGIWTPNETPALSSTIRIAPTGEVGY